MRALGMIVFCIVLAGLGAAGGWLASMRKTQAPDDGPGHEDEAEAHADEGLSPQALKNLGVEVMPVKLGTWIRSVEIQAVVADRPENHRPVVAPLGGRITAVHVVTGARVNAGQPIATIARDPIPRPKSEFTGQILLPISEDVHEAAESLRNARQRLDIARRELARLQSVREAGSNLPLVARNRLIELSYEKERAELAVRNARHELDRHGVTAPECSTIEGGGECPPNPSLWARVLRVNGLWSGAADRIMKALPEATRELPWAIAAVGELSAAGLATDALAKVMETTPEAAQRFAEVAGLLLQGTPLETVALLARIGALEPHLVVRAPTGHAPDYDVHEVTVRVGQAVKDGDEIVELYDARSMWLKVTPVGSEIAAVVAAIENDVLGAAEPLIEGAGPRLEGVDVQNLHTHKGEGEIAYAIIENTPLPGSGPRTWRLRPGTRYALRLPTTKLEKRWVLPVGAVTEDGAELVVFVQDGASYRAVPVHIEDRTAQQVVIANDGSLFPGDPVVVRGAFALGLALQKGKGGDTGGHGHSHN